MTAGSTPDLGLGADTAWVEADGVVYAAVLPDGPPLVLDGPGAAVWRAVVLGGPLTAVVERVAAEVGTSADVVAADVGTFVGSLLEAGLVVETVAVTEVVPDGE